MKKIVIFTAVFLSILLGICFYAVFYSHGFPGFLLSKWIQTQYPTLELKSFDYKKRSFHLWDEIVFLDLRMVLKNGKSTERFFVPSLIVKSDHALWENDKEVTISIDQAAIEGENLKVQGIGLNLILNFQRNTPMRLHGNLKAASVDFAPYRLKDISTLLKGGGNTIRLKNFLARGYGGNISGEILLEDISMLSYDVDFKLLDIDSNKLRSINSEIFSQVDGKLDGKIRLTGAAGGIKTLTCDSIAHPGATVKASLLELLMNYIPQSTQKRDLEQLIKTHGSISLDKAWLHLRSVAEDKLSMTIDLESQKFNLNVGLTVDINLDVPLESLFDRLIIFSKKEKP